MNKVLFLIEKLLFTFKTLLKLPFLARFTKLPMNNLINSDVIILGNGPSLNESIKNNFTFFENKTLFCNNFFGLSDEFILLKPRYYVIIDPAFFRNDTTESIKDKRKKLFQTIKEKTHWDLTLFLPYSAKKHKYNYPQLFENKNIKLIYFNNIKIEGFKNFIFLLTKWNLGLPIPQNVIIPCITLAINLKFKNIYLAGADHDWIKNIRVNEKNELFLLPTHFYENEKIKFERVYFNGKEANTYEVLEAFAKMFRSYFLINEYSKKRNAKIINITPNSFIDAFEKQELKN